MIVRFETSSALSQLSIVRHLAREDVKRRRQGDAELGFLDQGEQVLAAVGQLAFFFGKGCHGEQCGPRFLSDLGRLGLGRLADHHLGFMHLGQFDHEPALELDAKLDEQFLD